MNKKWYEWFPYCIQNYVNFEGRASRSEYWYFNLIYCLTSIVIGELSLYLSIIYFLLIFLPSLAVTVRRLHDIGKSGWYLLLSLIPIVGLVILIVFFVTDSQKGPNKYGMMP